MKCIIALVKRLWEIGRVTHQISMTSLTIIYKATGKINRGLTPIVLGIKLEWGFYIYPHVHSGIVIKVQLSNNGLHGALFSRYCDFTMNLVFMSRVYSFWNRNWLQYDIIMWTNPRKIILWKFVYIYRRTNPDKVHRYLILKSATPRK